jgi:hypothetical protein
MAFSVRERWRVPPSQDAEHALHVPQSAGAQSIGHGCFLHVRDSSCAPHGTPPVAASRLMPRERVCRPPPHVREHSP